MQLRHHNMHAGSLQARLTCPHTSCGIIRGTFQERAKIDHNGSITCILHLPYIGHFPQKLTKITQMRPLKFHCMYMHVICMQHACNIIMIDYIRSLNCNDRSSRSDLPAVAVNCLPVVQELLDDGLGSVRALPSTHHSGHLVFEEQLGGHGGTIPAQNHTRHTQ